MINLNCADPHVTTGSKQWLPMSQVSLNINSLSATKSGGIGDRFAKILCLICFLLNSTNILHLQDIRIPDDNYINCLKSVLPHYTFAASAYDTNSAGVVTIFKTSLNVDYDIQQEVLHKGHILSTSFTHKTTNHNFTCINSYLHASNVSIWCNQIKILQKFANKQNSIIVGDFNHAQHLEDRSGFHKDKTSSATEIFQDFLSDPNCNYQEIPQPHHTYYAKKNGRLVSSRIDLAFHNFDFINTARFAPSVKVLTSAPYTVTIYNNHSKTSDILDDDTDTMPQQLISSLLCVNEGGSHVTDHLPISITFNQCNSGSKFKSKFRSNAVYHQDYKQNVTDIWYGTSHSGDWRTDMQDLSDTLTNAAKITNTKHVHKDKDQDIWDAIRLVSAIDDKSDSISADFAHIPDYLNLANDPDSLVTKINNELATKTYGQNSSPPLSKIQTIAKTLPNDKSKITQLYSPQDDCITDNPAKMTSVALQFWGDKWKKVHIHNPRRLFRLYGKKLLQQPDNIDIDYIIDVINDTNDSAPGPDGIPFAAYRAVPELSATVFLAAIQGMMNGDLPNSSFNSGILHLLPKKNTDRIEDTRPLVINNTNNRIIATVIQRSINDPIEAILSDNQNGFRHLRSTAPNISYFNEQFYSAHEQHRFYDILFIDFLKAFDSIAHDAIYALLGAINMPNSYINIIKALFHNAYCYTNFGNASPAKIHFHSGVKQGCPLSPTLFILVIDVLLDMFESIPDLTPKFYADDGALGSNNIVNKLPTIKKILTIFKRHTGLEMNVQKSAIVATGGRTHLRSALDDIGWDSLPISDNERYLGTYIGHNTTLDHIFKGPFDKFHKRLKSYQKVKKNYSLQSRVLIWNTWLIPIFSYVFLFHSLPTDYLDWIDTLCIQWIGVANTLKPLHLARPTHLLGLTTPLKDTTIFNYSLLASRANSNQLDNNTYIWSPRCSTHRISAKLFLQEEYNIVISTNTPSSTIYNAAINSNTFKINTLNYIKHKLNKINIINQHQKHTIANYACAPSWVPSYVRDTIIKITHNALLTSRRLRGNDNCFLCGKALDDIGHIWYDCSVARAAASRFWSVLDHQRACNIHTSICADDRVAQHIVGAQYMLTDSIWRARCSAQHGLTKDLSGWSYWIADNALTRISKISPTFFNNNFPTNYVPNNLKISNKLNMGSSKHNNANTRSTANAVVDNTIANLPNGTYFAFTDGSANPNPGPTGSGAAIYRKNGGKVTLCTALSAAIGHADNNVGEFCAIGLVAEYLTTTHYTGDITIFTDSNLARGSLMEGWSSGGYTFFVHQIRQLIRDRTGNTIIKWVPGHSDISYNDTADKLAGAGAVAAADNGRNHTDIVNIIRRKGFLSFVT